MCLSATLWRRVEGGGRGGGGVEQKKTKLLAGSCPCKIIICLGTQVSTLSTQRDTKYRYRYICHRSWLFAFPYYNLCCLSRSIHITGYVRSMYSLLALLAAWYMANPRSATYVCRAQANEFDGTSESERDLYVQQCGRRHLWLPMAWLIKSTQSASTWPIRVDTHAHLYMTMCTVWPRIIDGWCTFRLLTTWANWPRPIETINRIYAFGQERARSTRCF